MPLLLDPRIYGDEKLSLQERLERFRQLYPEQWEKVVAPAIAPVMDKIIQEQPQEKQKEEPGYIETITKGLGKGLYHAYSSFAKDIGTLVPPLKPLTERMARSYEAAAESLELPETKSAAKNFLNRLSQSAGHMLMEIPEAVAIGSTIKAATASTKVAKWLGDMSDFVVGSMAQGAVKGAREEGVSGAVKGAVEQGVFARLYEGPSMKLHPEAAIKRALRPIHKKIATDAARFTGVGVGQTIYEAAKQGRMPTEDELKQSIADSLGMYAAFQIMPVISKLSGKGKEKLEIARVRRKLNEAVKKGNIEQVKAVLDDFFENPNVSDSTKEKVAVTIEKAKEATVEPEVEEARLPQVDEQLQQMAEKRGVDLAQWEAERQAQPSTWAEEKAAYPERQVTRVKPVYEQPIKPEFVPRETIAKAEQEAEQVAKFGRLPRGEVITAVPTPERREPRLITPKETFLERAKRRVGGKAGIEEKVPPAVPEEPTIWTPRTMGPREVIHFAEQEREAGPIHEGVTKPEIQEVPEKARERVSATGGVQRIRRGGQETEAVKEITTKSGKPFKTKGALVLQLRRQGLLDSYEPVKTDEGWIGKPKEAIQPESPKAKLQKPTPKQAEVKQPWERDFIDHLSYYREKVKKLPEVWERVSQKQIKNNARKQHKKSISQALKENKLTPEQYNKLHAKDYGEYGSEEFRRNFPDVEVKGEVERELKGKKQREKLQEELRNQADEIRKQIYKEIKEYKPIGRASEIAQVVGVKPKRDQEAISILGTVYVFKKKNAPTQEKVREWENLHKKAEQLDKEAINLSFSIIEPGRVIGNKKVLEQGKKLKEKDLLDKEEVEFVNKLENFWKKYPDADTGIVKKDGSIEPVFPKKVETEEEVKVKRPVKPFGDVPPEEEYTWMGTRVKVIPSLKKAKPWTGTVERVLNNGTLIEVKPDEHDTTFRVRGDQIEILEKRTTKQPIEKKGEQPSKPEEAIEAISKEKPTEPAESTKNELGIPLVREKSSMYPDVYTTYDEIFKVKPNIAIVRRRIVYDPLFPDIKKYYEYLTYEKEGDKWVLQKNVGRTKAEALKNFEKFDEGETTEKRKIAKIPEKEAKAKEKKSKALKEQKNVYIIPSPVNKKAFLKVIDEAIAKAPKGKDIKEEKVTFSKPTTYGGVKRIEVRYVPSGAELLLEKRPDESGWRVLEKTAGRTEYLNKTPLSLQEAKKLAIAYIRGETQPEGQVIFKGPTSEYRIYNSRYALEKFRENVKKSTGIKQYALGEKPEKPLTKPLVDLIVKKASAGWKEAPEITMVERQSDLPKEVQRIEPIKGVYYNGKVYLVAENLASHKDVVKTLAEEVIGHAGLRKALDSKLYDQTLDNLWNKHKDDILPIAKEYKLDVTKPEQRRQAVDEWIAKQIADDSLPKRIWQRLVFVVKAFARKLGYSGNLTLNEIKGMLRAGVNRKYGLPVEGEKRFALGKVADTEQLKEAAEVIKETEKEAEAPESIKPFMEKVKDSKAKDFLAKTKNALLEAFAPELLHEKGKEAEAKASELVAKELHAVNVIKNALYERKLWWDKLPESARLKYIISFEEGDNKALMELAGGNKKVYETLQAIKNEHRELYDKIYEAEKKAGIELNYIKDYWVHLWKDPDKAARVFRQFRETMGKDPFTRSRILETIKQGLELGLELKTTNPEEMVIARINSGVRAIVRQKFVDWLVQNGLAYPYKKGIKLSKKLNTIIMSPEGWPYAINKEYAEKLEKIKDDRGKIVYLQRLIKKGYAKPYYRGTDVANRKVIDAPNGKAYAVVKEIVPLMENAGFLLDGPKSLWVKDTPAGMSYRALMRAKNMFIPIKLGMSLFHATHIGTIMMPAVRTGIILDALEGGRSWGEAIKELAKVSTGITQIKEVKEGLRLGKLLDKPLSELSPADRQAVQYILEGGFTTQMPHEWKVEAKEAFDKALASKNIAGIFGHGVRRLVELSGSWLFEYYVPALKRVAYLKRVRDLMARRPELADKPNERLKEFTKIRKSIDNQFGELTYKTLFWKPILKDIGIGSMLSMGWNLGFVREYGGAAVDTARFFKELVKKEGKAEITGRMLFVLDYTIQSLLLGGLLTWALTGSMPQKLIDYIYPRTGDQEPDGTPTRLNTPYYTREFGAIAQHIKTEGVIEGLLHTFKNKANPMIAPILRLWSNKDFYGTDIRDPHAPILTQTKQFFEYLAGESLPISISSAKRGAETMGWAKSLLLSELGFTKAPAYARLTPLQSKIFKYYSEYQDKRMTKDEAERERIKRKMRVEWLTKGKISDETWKEAFDKDVFLATKTSQVKANITRFIKSLRLTSDVRAFAGLPADIQVSLLKEMNEEELKKFLPHAKGIAKIRYYRFKQTKGGKE